MPNPLVSFVIATYNRGQVAVDCLQRVLANGLPRSAFEILVVDNASTDGTPELIEQRAPEAKLLRLQKNCGPVAKNFAIKQARGEFIVLLDDDAFPQPGAVAQMIRHFHDDPHLGAAVFDVTLPDGTREASAYPDVFIGAGTGLRRSVLNQVGGGGVLPHDFFMQAEEYDLSFRIIEAGYSVQRFWDLPLTHLKSPGARIGQRTTRLDVRNNLYLLAKYLPEPLCHEVAADWLSRYFMMAMERDRENTAPHPQFGTHKQSYIKGAAEGLARWAAKREDGMHLLSTDSIERIFKFELICQRLGRALYRTGAGDRPRKILFADFGKNMLAYYRAARQLKAQVLAIVDDNLAGPPGTKRDYRGVPIIRSAAALWHEADLVIVSNMSPVHGPRRAAALRRTLQVPVTDLFSRRDPLVQRGVETELAAAS